MNKRIDDIEPTTRLRKSDLANLNVARKMSIVDAMFGEAIATRIGQVLIADTERDISQTDPSLSSFEVEVSLMVPATSATDAIHRVRKAFKIVEHMFDDVMGEHVPEPFQSRVHGTLEFPLVNSHVLPISDPHESEEEPESGDSYDDLPPTIRNPAKVLENLRASMPE